MKIRPVLLLSFLLLIIIGCKEETKKEPPKIDNQNQPKVYCYPEQKNVLRADYVTIYINLHWFEKTPEVQFDSIQIIHGKDSIINMGAVFSNSGKLSIYQMSESTKELLVFKLPTWELGKNDVSGKINYKGKSYPFSTSFNCVEPGAIIFIDKNNQIKTGEPSMIHISSSIYPIYDVNVVPSDTTVKIKLENADYGKYSITPQKEGTFELNILHKEGFKIGGVRLVAN